MTRRRLAAKIDYAIAKLDPDAVRRAKEFAEDRFVTVSDSVEGMAEVVARCFDTTGKALDARLDQLADTVCGGDPRSKDQRRADALDALVAGADRLACRCGHDSCPAWMRKRPPGNVVIHVVAEQATLDGTAQTPAVIAGSDGLIPAETLRAIAAAARRLPIIAPIGAAPEPGYVPSRGLADFVRCRDLTCRAPGCDTPAVSCDVDHTIAFRDGGATHASNLKILCRKHHLLKTFWGWRDEQLPDATVIWTLPDGQRYVTSPGSAVLFPALCVPTATLPTPEPANTARCQERTAMMPRRSHTRAQNTAAVIAVERRRNHERRMAHKRAIAARISGGPPLHPDGEPPPF
jgi:5-methylcytosine-specific restriction endonuclease McrA